MSMGNVPDASAALRNGTLTDVYDALDGLRADPAQITDQLAGELANFFLKLLRRIYRTWSGKANDDWIPLSPWGGFIDSADDEALFEKTAEVLASRAADVEEILKEYESPALATAGGRLSAREASVLPMLRHVVERLSASSHPGVADAAKRLMDDIARDAV